MRMVDGSFWLHPKGPYVTMQDLWEEEDSSAGKANIQAESFVG